MFAWENHTPKEFLTAKVNSWSKSLKAGVGVNDCPHAVSFRSEKGLVVWKPYVTWSNMISRCYSKNSLKLHPSYTDCRVSKHWHKFSNFLLWLEDSGNFENLYRGFELDKDLMSVGNRIYSKNKCCFIDYKLNRFLGFYKATLRGDLAIGVKRERRCVSTYNANCWNPFKEEDEYLGVFKTEMEAHLAWFSKKNEHILNFQRLGYFNHLPEKCLDNARKIVNKSHKEAVKIINSRKGG